MKNKLRPIAINLPQYHPIPENDEWWGKGFTEWTNVSKAAPRFPFHYQPHLPADLGFYDLRLKEARDAQAELAKQYGIYGFCYYHYWFNGKQLLEKPVKEILKDKTQDFPFMLCWANENWTRTWDGGDRQILMKQDYNSQDDLEHIRYLISIFKDPRYIRVDGKPVFCVYRSDLFPDMRKTLAIWRKEARDAGLELYLCRFETAETQEESYLKVGFDAAIEFQPHGTFKYIYRKFNNKFFVKLIRKLSLMFFSYELPIVIPYKKIIEENMNQSFPNYKRYPCVMPSWDNSARRRRRFLAFYNSTPDYYYMWLKNILNRFKPYSKEENFLFINAWNEWGEGNHLEPDQKWKRGYLEMTRKAFMESCE
ncbi:MAG: glycoside hydrolase family 99-like domain-containing protein [Bacteroidales bacterium]